MPRPVLLVVDEDQVVLEDVATQLVQRYAPDYRVETFSEPRRALRMLAELASAGEDVALVLVGKSLLDATSGELFDRARQLHPHARRGLVVPAGALAHPPTAEAILNSMALGRIDYYVPRPAGSLDEVFHQAISSFLLEWRSDRRSPSDRAEAAERHNAERDPDASAVRDDPSSVQQVRRQLS